MEDKMELSGDFSQGCFELHRHVQNMAGNLHATGQVALAKSLQQASSELLWACWELEAAGARNA